MVRPEKDPWPQLEQTVHYVKNKNYLDSVALSEKSGIGKAWMDFVAEGKFFFFSPWGTAKDNIYKCIKVKSAILLCWQNLWV